MDDTGNKLVAMRGGSLPAAPIPLLASAEGSAPAPTPKQIWRAAAWRLRRAFVATLVFSVFINVLVLALPIYTLQVFDRVLSGRSVETLLALTGILIVLLLAQTLLDTLRAMLLRRAGTGFEMSLNETVLRHAMEEAAQGNPHAASGAADLKTVRSSLAAPTAAAVFDVPWAPIFLLLIFAMHPLLGSFVAGALGILFVLALMSLLAARRPKGEENNRVIAAGEDAVDYLRNADAVRALGMGGALSRKWSRTSAEILELNAKVTSRVSSILGLTKFVRMSVQGGIMGLGAYLVILGEITPGTMIAASILMARALAPAEQAISGWRGWSDARAAYKRLRKAVHALPVHDRRVTLPKPTGRVVLENVSFEVGAGPHAVLNDITLSIGPGSALGIIGPSGAGKSTLARMIVGSIAPTHGRVLYDGAQWSQWDPDRIGAAFGYLPQDVQLLNGTVAENISRFAESPKSEDVLEAAKIAGVHDLIVSLPQGYDTRIGDGELRLSGGQRQRIGLARAIYRNPSIVVLDEPNANLDPEGEAALHSAIAILKQQGATVIVVSHSPSLLRVVNHVAVIRDGTITAIGPRDEVIRQVREGSAPARQVEDQRSSNGPSAESGGS